MAPQSFGSQITEIFFIKKLYYQVSANSFESNRHHQTFMIFEHNKISFNYSVYHSSYLSLFENINLKLIFFSIRIII